MLRRESPPASPEVDPLGDEVVAFALGWVRPGQRATGLAAATRTALTRHGAEVAPGDLDELSGAGLEAVLLLDDELAVADHERSVLLNAAAEALRPGGLLVATLRSRVWATNAGADDAGTVASHQVERAIGSRGFSLQALCAPGAAARLRGAPPTLNPDLDREPGLLDAAPRMLLVARAPMGDHERSATFFDTLPRKIVAAGTLCRHTDGRVLIVHDRFKNAWTIPGGIVEADEDPRRSAARETWEESGVRVDVGALLGVFAGSWPDRLIFVYAATPTGDAQPRPVHAQEIDAAEWVGEAEALRRVPAHIRFQVRHCLDAPGGTWVQPSGWRSPDPSP